MRTTILTDKEIIDIIRRHRDVLNKYTVKKIGLFGSFVKGKQKKDSDIDLIVEFEEPTLDNFMDLISYLENLFGRNIEVLTPDGIRSIRIREVADDINRSVIYV